MRTTKHQLIIQNYSMREQLIDKTGTIEHLRLQLAEAVHSHSIVGVRLKLAQSMGHLDITELEKLAQWVANGASNNKEAAKI